MIRQLLGLVALVVSGAGAYESVPSPAGSSILTPATDTVRVAPPTGAAATDRASILAAVDKLEPAGTLQFAAGTYLVGERVRVPVPGVTILGHPAGTTLRGCDPAELENPLVFPDFRDPLARTFAEMYWRGTCDLGAGVDAIARTGPRAPWRPHFLYDDAPRIDVPVLRFFAPQIESRSVDLRRLDRLASIAASDHCGDQVARDYFIALAADEERVAAIRQVLTEGDLALAVHDAMGRAFGTNLRTVMMEGDFAGREAIRDFRDPHIRSFLEDVALREAARPPAPALDSQPRE